MLQRLQDRYGGQGFNVLGFPSNDFAEEEPGSNAEIKRFATSRFNVSFPMFAKIPVIGAEAHPLFKHIAGVSVPPRWNFHKYLVNGAGEVIANFDPKIEPDSEALIAAIEKLLNA